MSKKEEIVNKIFYITMGIYFFFSAMTLTMIEQNNKIAISAKIIRYICYFLIFLVIIYNIIRRENEISIKQIFMDCWNYLLSHLLLIVVLMVAAIIFAYTKQYVPFILILLIWACSFYDIRKIISIYLKTTLFLMILTWGLSFFEIVQEIAPLREDKIRYSLGYIYPLELMTHFLFLVISYIYILNKKFSVKDYIIINIINFLLYKITDARTSFCLVIAVTFVFLIYAKTNMEHILTKIDVKFYYCFLILCFIGSIALGIVFDYENEILIKIDEFLSGRIYLMRMAFDEYGIPLFGKRIEWIGFGGSEDVLSIMPIYNFVDCAYAKMLLDYGIIFSILVFIGYAFVYKTAKQEQDYALIIVLSVVLVVSVMEPRLISIEMNPLVLFLGRFFLKENNTKLFIHTGGSK